MNINTLKPGNKIGLCNKGYDVNANPYIYGIGIKQDSSSTTVAYMDYYCNAGLKSGYRFYRAVTKILDVSVSSVIHIEKSAVICGDSNLVENNKANEISLLFKRDISDSVSDSLIVVSNASNFVHSNSRELVVTSGVKLTESDLFRFVQHILFEFKSIDKYPENQADIH